MGQGTITVLDPVARTVARQLPLAPRLRDLNGKVIGILWNGKPNGDILLCRLQQSFEERFKLAGSVWQKKASASIPGTEAVKELALSADFVIAGQGD